jgi:hypothetical protein
LIVGANLQPAKDVILRFRAQALLLIGQATADHRSCRSAGIIGERDINEIAWLQIFHWSFLFFAAQFIALSEPQKHLAYQRESTRGAAIDPQRGV